MITVRRIEWRFFLLFHRLPASSAGWFRGNQSNRQLNFCLKAHRLELIVEKRAKLSSVALSFFSGKTTETTSLWALFRDQSSAISVDLSPFSDKSACVFRSSVTWFSYTMCPPDRMQWRLWNFPRHSGNVLIPIGNFGQCVPFGVARMFNVSYIANSKVSIVSIYGLAGCRKMEYIDFSYRLW